MGALNVLDQGARIIPNTVVVLTDFDNALVLSKEKLELTSELKLDGNVALVSNRVGNENSEVWRVSALLVDPSKENFTFVDMNMMIDPYLLRMNGAERESQMLELVSPIVIAKPALEMLLHEQARIVTITSMGNFILLSVTMFNQTYCSNLIPMKGLEKFLTTVVTGE